MTVSDQMEAFRAEVAHATEVARAKGIRLRWSPFVVQQAMRWARERWEDAPLGRAARAQRLIVHHVLVGRFEEGYAAGRYARADAFHQIRHMIAEMEKIIA